MCPQTALWDTAQRGLLIEPLAMGGVAHGVGHVHTDRVRLLGQILCGHAVVSKGYLVVLADVPVAKLAIRLGIVRIVVLPASADQEVIDLSVVKDGLGILLDRRTWRPCSQLAMQKTSS